ncbi:MAG: hypothetical protein OXM02_05845 [Bacteroidota bacterium]|nr:hypothetical protein [Bacteroidota bacterium]MDE2957239.1 hypothetical protein [Bacteroidota bacterium]
MPIFLLLGAATVGVIGVLVLVWLQIDRRLRGMADDRSVDELAARLKAAETEAAQLRERVEDLEAIATAGQLPERAK